VRAAAGLLLAALVLLARAAAAAPEPANLTILGASGDLTGRLLMPSLIQLAKESLLPPGSRVIGVGPPSAEYPDDPTFRGWMKARVRSLAGAVDEQTWPGFADRLHFQAADVDRPADLVALKERLSALSAADGPKGRRNIFYLALPPTKIKAAIEGLAAAGLIGPGVDGDVVVEKPIGVDEKSAREINDLLDRTLGEAHTFRMDHFLGKPNVRRILDLRFSDPRFARVWNKRFIDRIDVDAGEQIGIEGRGAFMEGTGALRDMVQSHLLQALSVLIMDRPRTLAPDAIRAEKIKALESIRPMSVPEAAKKVVRGQYTAADGRRGYREEPGVARDSTIETYVAVPIDLGLRSFRHVPVVLHTGKAEAEKDTSIAVHFKRLPPELTPKGRDPGEGGTLRFAIAPRPGITLDGQEVALPARGPELLPYARQIADVLARDQSMFLHRRESEAAWRVVDPIERAFRLAGARGLRLYPAGSRGPKQADRLRPAAR
jgi:glucose-6-phosphate 1-dehydrogenase